MCQLRPEPVHSGYRFLSDLRSTNGVPWCRRLPQSGERSTGAIDERMWIDPAHTTEHATERSALPAPAPRVSGLWGQAQDRVGLGAGWRSSPERLIDAVLTVATGDAFLGPAVTRDLVRQLVIGTPRHQDYRS